MSKETLQALLEDALSVSNEESKWAFIEAWADHLLLLAHCRPNPLEQAADELERLGKPSHANMLRGIMHPVILRAMAAETAWESSAQAALTSNFADVRERAWKRRKELQAEWEAYEPPTGD